MRVIFNYKRYHSMEQAVAIALGTFDGMHKGHQELMSELHKLKLKYGYATMAYTFLDHPLSILDPSKTPPQIMTIHEKILAFEKTGIDWLILNPFDTEFSSISAESFIEDFLLNRYNVQAIVVGYNFRFGSGGKGDVELLKQLSKKFDYKLIVVPPILLDENVISSSLIRKYIQEGQIKKANSYLGNPYSIYGRVIHGYGRGQQLGFPTANLKFNHDKVIPKHGVYITRVYVDNRVYWGVTNVGRNPTFNSEGINLETHLIYYNGNLYDKKMKVEFLYRLRGERVFSTVEDLKRQIGKDINYVKNFIYKHKSI